MAADKPVFAGDLAIVKDPGPALQAEAEKRLPLGWCNFCVGRAKEALAEGREPGPVKAAVTTIPRVQMMPMAELGGSVPAVFTIPACWDDLGAQKASKLLQGQAGTVG